jgi:hypothetical protein
MTGPVIRTLITPEEKNRLLRKYWSIPGLQVKTSVVLTDKLWFVMGGES